MTPDKPNLVGNAADEEQVKQAGEKILRGREKLLFALAEIGQTKSGRLVCYKWLTEAKMFGAIYSGSTNDTMFNLGKREMGLVMHVDLEEALGSELYAKMISEGKAAEPLS